jgi:hypothetical protein
MPDLAVATLPYPQSAVTAESACLMKARPSVTAIVKNFMDFKNYMETI